MTDLLESTRTDITPQEKMNSIMACDVFVYGSTPGGCAATIEAARRGCKVILACPQQHPGGMMASGLSTTDDVHPCHDQRYAVDGFMEGVLWYPKKSEGPAQPGQVRYGAMLPRHLNNLLVPVAMSSTHVAMSVLRMEPLWMTIGQIAGLAATQAMDKGIDVANLDPEPLPRTLGIRIDPYN
ncbi:MAG: FAD-dependent oxidoreductase [Candidatus Poribacteria bacterium]|nr:FAD-dependent oxidoreductase [Candidatus Poribacteria bacterium]